MTERRVIRFVWKGATTSVSATLPHSAPALHCLTRPRGWAHPRHLPSFSDRAWTLSAQTQLGDSAHGRKKPRKGHLLTIQHNAEIHRSAKTCSATLCQGSETSTPRTLASRQTRVLRQRRPRQQFWVCFHFFPFCSSTSLRTARHGAIEQHTGVWRARLIFVRPSSLASSMRYAERKAQVLPTLYQKYMPHVSFYFI